MKSFRGNKRKKDENKAKKNNTQSILKRTTALIIQIEDINYLIIWIHK